MVDLPVSLRPLDDGGLKCGWASKDLLTAGSTDLLILVGYWSPELAITSVASVSLREIPTVRNWAVPPRAPLRAARSTCSGSCPGLLFQDKPKRQNQWLGAHALGDLMTPLSNITWF